jgi:hypothetical protein
MSTSQPSVLEATNAATAQKLTKLTKPSNPAYNASMPGWDVEAKIRPGKEEKKKSDPTPWVIVAILGVLLLILWYYGQGHNCGIYQDGVHCDQGYSSQGSSSPHSSGHHRHHP